MSSTNPYPSSDDEGTSRDDALRRHLGLVVHVARQLSNGRADHVELDDLISAGTLGLIEAFEHFDASRGLAFSTFAAPRIRGAMLDELRRADRVPRSVRRKTRAIDGAATTLARALGRQPRTVEVADNLGVDLSTLWRWQAEREATRTVSLEHAPRTHRLERAGWIVDSSIDDLEQSITQAQEAEHLREGLLRLPEQERTVLSLYYFENLTLSDIGRVLDVSESRVSQVRSKGIQRLRRMLGRLRAPAGRWHARARSRAT